MTHTINTDGGKWSFDLGSRQIQFIHWQDANKNFSSHVDAVIEDVEDFLNVMSDTQLDDIYETLVGYRPITEGDSRAECIDLILDQQKEIIENERETPLKPFTVTTTVVPSHTAGPWTLIEKDEPGYEESNTLAIVDVEGYCITDVYNAGELCGDLDLRKECISNARLIASAPELLQALVNICSYVSMREFDTNVLRQMIEQEKHLINKAKGL